MNHPLSQKQAPAEMPSPAAASQPDSLPQTNPRVHLSAFGGPEKVQVTHDPSVPEPQAGEARVRVEASSVLFTDTLVRKGIYSPIRQAPPFTLGYDLVGTVDAVGPGVTDVAVGARVADLPQIGAQAQYVCRPANRLVPIPDGPDPSEAVCLVLSYMTAYQMLHRVAGVQRGQRVLVHGGSGAVGTAFLQLGRLLDLDIVTTASPQHHDRLRALGATPIDYRAPDYAEQLQAAARDGFDAAFDAVGPSSLRRSRRLLRPGGTLVAYGTTATAQTISRRTPLQFVRFGLTFGLMMAGLTLWNALPNGHTAAFYGITSMREAHPEWFRDDLDALFALLADGQLTPRVHVLPLSEARRAHILVDRGAADGQVVLLPQPLPV